MVTIESFLKEELNNYNQKVILKAIQDGKNSQKELEEITFNRYSLEVLFPDKKVLIHDDIFSEDEALELDLDDFIGHLQQHQ